MDNEPNQSESFPETRRMGILSRDESLHLLPRLTRSGAGGVAHSTLPRPALAV